MITHTATHTLNPENDFHSFYTNWDWSMEEGDWKTSPRDTQVTWNKIDPIYRGWKNSKGKKFGIITNSVDTHTHYIYMVFSKLSLVWLKLKWWHSVSIELTSYNGVAYHLSLSLCIYITTLKCCDTTKQSVCGWLYTHTAWFLGFYSILNFVGYLIAKPSL